MQLTMGLTIYAPPLSGHYGYGLGGRPLLGGRNLRPELPESSCLLAATANLPSRRQVDMTKHRRDRY
jgi:hypothetical protein